MGIVARFSLARHQGPYETWPLRTRLHADGKPTEVCVSGYELLHQFETPAGYLLVTDYDCPFEEATSFILLRRDLRLVSYRTLSVPYGSFSLDRIEQLADDRFRAVFYDNDAWLVVIRSWGIPYLRPRLQLKRIGGE